MQAVRFEGIFTSFSSRVDGSLGFRGSTPELTVQEKVALMSIQGLLTEVLIYPKEEKDAELIQVKAGMDHKSPSQRMRAVLFLMWKGSIEDVPFETYYNQKMEGIIDWLKTKLPEPREQ
jgi:hypothetical protein